MPTSLCPSRSLATFTCTPDANMCVAWVWRRSWNRMRGSSFPLMAFCHSWVRLLGLANYFCRECGEPVSGYAKRCPNCSDPFPLGNDPDRWLKVFLGSAAGLAVLWFAFHFFRAFLRVF